MTTPENNFDTWITLASSMIDDLSNFKTYSDEIIRLIDTIIKTNEYPNEIQEHKEIFIKKLKIDFLFKIFKLGKVSDEEFSYLFSLIKTILRFSKWGLEHKEQNIILLTEDILSVTTTSSFMTYNTKESLKVILPKYSAEIGFYEQSMKILEDETINEVIIAAIVNPCIRISTFVKDFDFFIFAKKVLTQVTKNVIIMIKTKKIRNVSTPSLSSIFVALKANAIVQKEIDIEFISILIKLLKTLLEPEIFEKRLFSFNCINELVTTKETRKLAVEFIAEDPSFLDGSIMHEAFTSQISSILRAVCEEDKCPFNLIDTLFGKHKVQFIAELPAFYNIFSKIASVLKAKYLEDFVKLIMNPSEKNKPWYELISNVGESLGERQDAKEAFNILRDNIFKLSEEGDEDATNIISDLLQFHLSEEKFEDLINKFTNKEITEKTFIIIKCLCSTYPFSDEKKPHELINKAIELIFEGKVNKIAEVLDCVFNIAFINTIKITQDKLDKLFQMYKSHKEILKFIDDMCVSELIENNELIQTIGNSKEEITQDLITFIETFIKRINNITLHITELPFIGEDLMWDLCMRKGKKQEEICSSLCQIYALNDGHILTDEKMIDTFINKWSNIFEETEDKTSLITILKTFIITIESPIDISAYGIKRHKPNKNTIKVTLQGTLIRDAMTYSLPSSLTIAAVTDMVSRLTGVAENLFSVEINTLKAVKTKTIYQYARSGEVKIFCNKIKNAELIKPLTTHRRTCIPSIKISNSHICQKLMKLLKDDVVGAKQLLDLLPTLKSTIYQINLMQNCPNYHLETLLDVECPSLFVYNLDGISARLDDSLKTSFVQEGGIKFLIECIPKTFNKTIIISIIGFISPLLTEELIDKYKQIAFDNTIDTLIHFVNNGVISTFIEEFINKLIQKPNEVICNNTEKYARLLLSSNEDVRKRFLSILKCVKCDQDAFKRLISEANTKEFFECFYNKMDHRDDELTALIFSKVKEELSPEYIRLAECIIEKNFASEEATNDLINHLIDNYLALNTEINNTETCTSIAKIVSHSKPDIIYERVKELHSKKYKFDKPRIDGDTSESKTGFVGLVNLGATCYLNSTLQQFFMIPKIRNAIIEYKGDDEYMQEFSKIFAKLLLSNNRSVTTEPLIKKWKLWGNEMLNPHEQQDACEFVQGVIEKLEKGIGEEEIKNLFQCQAKIVIEGMNEKYISEAFDNQYTLTLEAKNTKDLETSINRISNPTFLTDNNQYKPEGWDHKIDAKEYHKLEKVPPYLIIQLARFDYNYQTWERIKINNVIEVPLEIDLKEHVPEAQKHTKYTLHGAIVHMGSAMFGHYISYIKERKPDGKWYCFNDESVTLVDEANALKVISGNETGKSGYILFYDREDYNNIEVNDPVIIKDVQEAVEYENNLNAQYRLFCSSHYFMFMSRLAESNDKKLHQLAMKYAFDVFPFTKSAINKENADKLYTNIINKMEEGEDISYIKDDIAKPLLTNPYDHIREYIAQILIKGSGIDPSFYLSLIDKSLENYRLSKNLFTVCSKKAIDLPEFPVRVLKFLREDVLKYKEEHSELREGYFFMGLDVSELFEGLSKCSINEGAEFLIEDKYLSYLMYSDNVSKLSMLIKSLPKSFNVEEKLKSFAERNSINVNYSTLAELLILVLGKEGIEITQNIKGKLYGKLATRSDLINVHIKIMAREGMNFYSDKLGSWIVDLLTDNEKIETRQNVQKFLSYIAPVKELIDLNVGLSDTLKASECKEGAQKVVDLLIDNIPMVIEKVHKRFSKPPTTIVPQQDYIATQYIETLDVLSGYAKILPEAIDKLLDGFTENRLPYDSHLRMTINLSKKVGILKNPEYFLSLIDLQPIIKEGYIPRCMKYLESILPLIPDSLITDQFTENFLEDYSFPTGIIAHINYGVIVSFIERLSVHHRDAIIKKFNEMGADELKKRNFSATITVLKATHEKRPLLNCLRKALTEKSIYNANQLIQFSFECDDGTPFEAEEDVLPIAQLAVLQEYNKETRNTVWRYITEKHNPTAEAFVKNFGSGVLSEDYVMYAKFLISSFENGESLNDSIDAVEALLMISSEDLSVTEFTIEFIKKEIKESETDKWIYFIKRVLRQNPHCHTKCYGEIMEISTKVCKSEDELCEILSPFYESVNEKCNYISDIAEYGGIIPEYESENIKDALSVISEHNIMTGSIIQGVGRMIYQLKESKEKYDTDIIKIARKVALV